MEQLKTDVFWPNKLVLESLNFADDIVRGDNGRKRAVFENGRTHCL